MDHHLPPAGTPTPVRSGIAPAALAAFRNRLVRNARHWRRWARRRDYGAWRIYERDLPEFPLAIDCYQQEGAGARLRVHLQEVETGWQQDAVAHRAWQDAVTDVVAQVLGVEARAIAVKERRKRRGREQHGKTGARGADFVVGEAGLRFIVNLEAYLDTGLFLDHRALRALVRERAAGRRLLNLFAYTGSFTVYAAAGGAAESASVDLSNTYLDWAARNFALNGLDTARHRLLRADAREWLDHAPDESQRYDLIVLDPPSFSNSRAMTGVLDIQRDHGWLVANARALLAPGGELSNSIVRLPATRIASTSPRGPCRRISATGASTGSGGSLRERPSGQRGGGLSPRLTGYTGARNGRSPT
jgi:23S rRNA (cytosine1962-C5)-methyltransferase